MSSSPPPLEETLLPLAEALEALGIRYVIGGSVASSLYGEPRQTADLDVVMELLDPQQLKALVQKVAPCYYIDEDAFRQAFRYKRSFSIISLKTYTKVDIFFPKPRALDRDAFALARYRPLEQGGERLFPIAPPEVIVLQKLEWYVLGGRSSARQWNDILGILRVQGSQLDLAYLRAQAVALQLRDLLEQALQEAGLQ
ncbi:MAG: hypothetical protein IMW90_04915 [Thermogemmatispora sp.]|uniref:hypothetical protein n=1 Tax=Thermogemmatispora sp. TaxID=1968838 RepID=UPI0019F15E52|nr:hypothetical protein [Thermogemmatispora sp.]MBE3565048.1 hypothetical protein [Thermogemmatispora sp.]